MKVFITKYALTDGIYQEDAMVIDDNMIECKYKDSHYSCYFHKPHWHKTEAEAIKKAQEMREKKLATLKKQIDKLENIFFEIKNPS